MQDAEIVYLWERIFGKSVHPDMISIFGTYVRADEEHEKTFLWFLMKSSGHIFADETARALWITDQVKQYHDQKSAQSAPAV